MRVEGLYRAYSVRVEAYVRRCFVGRADLCRLEVDDVVQAVWLRVCRRPGMVLGSRRPEGALMLVCRYVFLSAPRSLDRAGVRDDAGWVACGARSRGRSPVEELIGREAVEAAGVD